MPTKAELETEIQRLREEVHNLRTELARRNNRHSKHNDADLVKVTCASCKVKVEMTFAEAKGWRRHDVCPEVAK